MSGPAGPRAGSDPLCALLAGEPLPDGLDPGALETLWEQARADDVDALVAAPLARAARAHPALGQRIHERVADAGLRSLLRHRELCRLAASFGEESVPVLVIKGAGLAYTLYAEPHLRPSRDIDLFIRHDSRDAAALALARCGYTRMREPDGELARAQFHYTRTDARGINHFVDLHWRVSDARVFEAALTFDDGARSSVAVPTIEPPLRTPCHAHALLLACVHRVAHHHDDPCLLWLWDIHLLAVRLTAEDWEQFLADAARTGMRAVSVRGLELAGTRFGTAVDARIFERLNAPGPDEPAAQFIGGQLRFVDVVRADLSASRSWLERAALLREHLFPAPAYMRAIYPRCRPALLLPLAYCDRILRGAPKWFRRRSQAR